MELFGTVIAWLIFCALIPIGLVLWVAGGMDPQGQDSHGYGGKGFLALLAGIAGILWLIFGG